MVYGPMVEEGAARGIRHLTYSRPGYGDPTGSRAAGSPTAPPTSRRSSTSSGSSASTRPGPRAGARTRWPRPSLLGDRVIAAATLAGVAPHDAEGLDWLEGMGEENHEEFGADALRGPGSSRPTSRARRRSCARSAAPRSRPRSATCSARRRPRRPQRRLRRVRRRGLPGGAALGDLGLVRRRHGLRPRLGVRSRRDRGPGNRLARGATIAWCLPHTALAGRRTSPERGRRRLPEEGHLSLELNRYGDVLDELLAAG